jgi:hypothetical protein
VEVSFTLANLPSSGVWTRVTPHGAAVAGGQIIWYSQTDGAVQVTARSPRSLGAGTYTGSLSVEVCSDAQCATQLQGSPVTLAVSYAVTGQVGPQTQVYWNTTQLNGAPFQTTQTTAPQFKVTIAVSNLPYPAMYLRRRAESGSIFSNIVFGDPTFTPNQGSAYGEYTVTLQPPAALGSGEFRGSLEFDACYDPHCTRIVPGSTYTAQVNFLVLASEGVEYSRRETTPPQGASEVVWSTANHSFYVLSNRGTSRNGNPGVDPQISQVDPATLQLVTTVSIPGENLRRLTVTPDGSRLYVASLEQSMLYRFALPTLTRDLSLTLENSPPRDPIVVNDFAMIPGSPNSFAVALEHKSRTDAVRVYDNAVLRRDVVAPGLANEKARWLVPAATPGMYLSQRFAYSALESETLDQMVVDGNGVRLAGSTPTTAQILLAEKPQRAGNNLYSIFGRVYDITSGAQIGSFDADGNTPASAFVVDELHGRIFVWKRGFLMSYNLVTLELLAIAQINVTPDYMDQPTMVLWGTEGVALTDNNRLVVFSGPFFTTYRGGSTAAN